MVIRTEEAERIAGYLRKRLDYLQICNAEIEGRLEVDASECINDGNDADSIGKYLFQIDCVVGNTFRYSMLIAACSFLEEAIKLLCRLQVPDYGSRLKAIRNGSWLSRHRDILREDRRIDLSAVESDWEKMADFVAIRNCIVHAWGKLDECRDKHEQRIAEVVDVDKVSYVSVSSDGFLVVEGEAFCRAADASRSIVGRLLQDFFGLSRDCI